MQMSARSEAASPPGHCALNPDGALPAPSRPLFPGRCCPLPPPPPARGALRRSRLLTATWVLAPEEKPGKLEAGPMLRQSWAPDEAASAVLAWALRVPSPGAAERGLAGGGGATRTMPSGGGEIIIIALTSAEGRSPCEAHLPLEDVGWARDCAFHTGRILASWGKLADVAWGWGSPQTRDCAPLCLPDFGHRASLLLPIVHLSFSITEPLLRLSSTTPTRHSFGGVFLPF